jgi:hypothetical protein
MTVSYAECAWLTPSEIASFRHVPPNLQLEDFKAVNNESVGKRLVYSNRQEMDPGQIKKNIGLSSVERQQWCRIGIRAVSKAHVENAAADDCWKEGLECTFCPCITLPVACCMTPCGRTR